MFRGGADYRSWPNSLIEGHKSTVVPDGQRKQISIRDLLRAQQRCVIENLDIGEADIVGPEAVMLGRLRHPQALQDRGYGQRIRIAGARHDSRRAVFSNRTGRPAMLELSGEPSGGDGMADVIGIEERNKNIDVEQRTHSVVFHRAARDPEG
jgi:hypothetical protein